MAKDQPVSQVIRYVDAYTGADAFLSHHRGPEAGPRCECRTSPATYLCVLLQVTACVSLAILS